MADARERETAPSTPTSRPDGAPGAADELAPDETTVMPEVAEGTPVRWVDVAAPWVADAGGDPAGRRLRATVVARVQLRYDETKADLVHDTEYECVLAPLSESVDPATAVAVDYDDRDLRSEPPDGAVYVLTDAPLQTKRFISSIESGLRDHLTRHLSLEIPTNAELKLYGRPGERAEEFAARCRRAADEAADAETAKLRDAYESKVTRLRDQIAAAEDRVDVLEEQATSRRNSELLSTAGSILGGLLGGRSRSSILGSLGTAAGRRGRTKAAGERLDAAENKVLRLGEQLEQLETELADDVLEIDARWSEAATHIEPMQISLERSDVRVSQLVVAWLPTSR